MSDTRESDPHRIGKCGEQVFGEACVTLKLPFVVDCAILLEVGFAANRLMICLRPIFPGLASRRGK